MIDTYRAKLTEWAAREAAEDQQYKPEALWELVVRGGRNLRHPQCRFIENWSRRIPELDPGMVADDRELRTLVTQREIGLKGPRARLVNLNRLRDWAPGVGVGRMDFRWVRVRQFMMDLHQGLSA